MKIRTQISPGICNFDVTVTACTEDDQNVNFEFISECETIKAFAQQIDAISPVDAIMTLGPEENPILLEARKLLKTKGCCEACVVPVGAVKIMQIATKLALPQDVVLTMTQE